MVLEMVLSGQFHGPAVLLGLSLTTADESRMFRAVVRASQRVGRWPITVLLRLMPLMARSAKTDPEHKKELTEDFKRNPVTNRGDVVEVHAPHGDRPCHVGQPGVGGPRRERRLRTHRRRAGNTRGGPQCDLGIIPGSVVLLPDEVPQRIAEVISATIAQAA